MADAASFFTLYESAAGYALLEIVSMEEISPSSESNQKGITDLSLFSRSVKLKAFQPFTSAEDALENINAISEHAMTDSLKSFLEMNLPRVSSKKKKEGKAAAFSVGVIDTGLANAIAEGIPGLSVRSDDTVREICRGARLHLTSLIKGLENGGINQAQLGLGHSYSRGKVKFNPARSDNMIIQSIALLDQMDKDLNTFAMRVKEWYSWHFPELKDLVKDNYMFARCAAFVADKKTLFRQSKGDDEESDEDEDMTEDKRAGLVEIVGDEEMANSIVAAAKTSMGMVCSEVDMINIINFTQRMVKLAEFRKQLALYLTDKMAVVAPNLSTLIGDTVAARLISKAGSLTNLAKAPASTVQILGAEKALFRALKTKGNTPKYGLIYHSTFIGRAAAKNKGRISRYLANKCSIATRIDSFSDEPTKIYGEKLREQVEERLKFYETGAAPRKNLDVMEEIRKSMGVDKKTDDDGDADMAAATPKSSKKSKKEKKDKKKRKRDSDDDEEEVVAETKKAKSEETTPAKKSPKSEKKSEKKSSKKKKKKSKSKD
jgi:nucleolar protein 56